MVPSPSVLCISRRYSAAKDGSTINSLRVDIQPQFRMVTYWPALENLRQATHTISSFVSGTWLVSADSLTRVLLSFCTIRSSDDP